MTISWKSQDQVQINIFKKRTNHLFKIQNSEVQTKYLRNNKFRNVNTQKIHELYQFNHPPFFTENSEK